MSDPDGPATSPERPEPDQAPSGAAQPDAATAGAQPGPAQPAAPVPAVPAPPVAAPVQAAYPVVPAAGRQHGAGFTVLVAAVTALVVAMVVATGTAFAVTRFADRDHHRVTVGISDPQRCMPDTGQRPDQSGREWDQQLGPDTGGPGRRGVLPGDPGSDGQGSTERGSTERGSTEQGESQPGS